MSELSDPDFLEQALNLAAYIVATHGENYLPVYRRLERERHQLHIREMEMAGIRKHAARHKATAKSSAKASDDKFAPGSFGCHEALHVASIAGDFIERMLIDHPAIATRPEWRELALKAHHALFDLYQAIGAEHLEGDDGPRTALVARAKRAAAAITPEEDAEITTAALADPDNPPAAELIRRHAVQRRR